MPAQVELVQAVQTASRQYCHRQLTWARGLPLFKWIDADQGQEAVVEQILSELQAAQHAGANAERRAPRCQFYKGARRELFLSGHSRPDMVVNICFSVQKAHEHEVKLRSGRLFDIGCHATSMQPDAALASCDSEWIRGRG